jgi:hypothetical protein
MAITFVGAGAIAANATTASQSISCHANTLTDDILICQLLSRDDVANTISPPDGTWTEVFTQDNNDGGGSNEGHQYAAFWKRATTGGAQSFTFTKATDDNLCFAGVISAWRGCKTSGSPIDATAVGITETTAQSANVSFPAFDPTSTTVHVVYLSYYNNETTGFSAAMSNDTNPDCTIRYQLGTSEGSDCGLACTSGDNDGSSIASRTWNSNLSGLNDDINTGVVFALVEQGAVVGRSFGVIIG